MKIQIGKLPKEKEIPCGRTEDDKWLCCRRRHRKFYEKKLVIDDIIFAPSIKRRRLFRVAFSIYCKRCGQCIESAGGSSLLEALRDKFTDFWV